MKFGHKFEENGKTDANAKTNEKYDEFLAAMTNQVQKSEVEEESVC